MCTGCSKSDNLISKTVSYMKKKKCLDKSFWVLCIFLLVKAYIYRVFRFIGTTFNFKNLNGTPCIFLLFWILNPVLFEIFNIENHDFSILAPGNSKTM